MPLPELTLGIEEEYQIIDPESCELTSFIQEFLEQGKVVLQDQIKPEFMQSQVEVGSRICRNVGEAREELIRMRRSVIKVAHDNGLRVAAASTHPFSSWSRQDITASPRAVRLEQDMRDLARRLLIFGMHVHIGIEDRELMIDVMNQARYFLPHLLALSTSSPFWLGRETGLKSYRSTVFETLPRSGLPPSFDSYADFESFVDTLMVTGCIDEKNKIWWDLRPHSVFPTLEFRIFDLCTRVDDAICLAAVTQAIVAKLIQLRRGNRSWRSYRHHLIQENKWRAVRYGIDGKLIDFGMRREKAARLLISELLDFVDDVVDELGSRKEVEHVHSILAAGTSADRQLETFHRTGSLHDVVHQLIEETEEGCEG